MKKTRDKRSRKKMVSLVIKDHVIRFIDAKYPGLRAIQQCGEIYLPSGVIEDGKMINQQRLLRIIQQGVKQWKIKNREVQFIIPDPIMICRKIDVPAELPDDEIKGYLYLELGSSIHLPFENPLFDIDILGVKDQKKEVLLFAAPENIVMEYSQLLERAGLKPVVADFSPLAIYRLFYKVESQPTTDPVLSIQFDLQTVTVSIFRHHKLMLVRQFKMNIPIDSWQVVQDHFGQETVNWKGEPDYLDYEVQVIMQEIGRFINFYYSSIEQEGKEIQKVILTGEYPYLKEIGARLEQVFQTPPITFENELFETQSRQLIMPKYYLPLGLSLKGGV